MFLKYTYICSWFIVLKNSVCNSTRSTFPLNIVPKNHLHWSLPLAVQFLRSNNIPLCNIPQVIHCFPEAFGLFPKKVFTFVNSIAPQYSHSCFLMSICKFFLDILHPGVELLDHKINKYLNSEDNTTGDP